MQKELLDQLETPCIVIDMARTEENVIRMQAEADAAGCRLRPHIKTHKMPLFTRMQLAHGAAGITCAKVSEAEVMADGGAEDIFIAYPMVGDFRIKRAIALAGRLKRLILAVDSMECAVPLNEAAKAARHYPGGSAGSGHRSEEDRQSREQRPPSWRRKSISFPI